MEIVLLDIQDKLISKADEELQGLFVEYGDIINAEMAIIYREIYICAFKDVLKSIGIIEVMKRELVGCYKWNIFDNVIILGRDVSVSLF